MAAWTINGKSFGKLGLSGLKRRRLSQAVDTVTFGKEVALYDEAEAFARGAAIEIKRDNETWFLGRVDTIARHGATRESLHYEVVGPWWYLENLVFQQEWTVWDTATEADITLSKSRIVLGQDATGARQNIGALITEVLQYAITAGAPLQVGTIGVSSHIPFNEAVDMSCAEVLRTVLRWVPDAVTWFDYSTSPPTLNVKRRGSLEAVALSHGKPLQAVSLDPVYELQAPAVVLKFEQLNQVDENVLAVTTVDKYPTTATEKTFGALVYTIELAGLQATTLTQEIEVVDLPTTKPQWIVWLNSRVPFLASNKVLVWDIIGDVAKSVDLPSELIAGVVPDWLDKNVEECEITCKVALTMVDGTEVEEKAVAVRITATDALNGQKQKVEVSQAAEEVPIGIAQALYESLSVLQWRGDFTFLEQECSDPVSLGKVVNLGGTTVAGWASMRALVQNVTEDVDRGTTLVSVGPPGHLSIQDFIELLRPNRSRGSATHAAQRATSTAKAPNITLQGKGRVENTSSGADVLKKMVIASTNKRIEIDPSLLNASQTMKPRLVDVCDGSTPKKMWILATEPFEP